MTGDSLPATFCLVYVKFMLENLHIILVSTLPNSFDQWFLKYSWSKLKAESGRFDLSAVQLGTTETTTTTVTTTTTTTETTTTTTTTTQPVQNTKTIEFTDTIASILLPQLNLATIHKAA